MSGAEGSTGPSPSDTPTDPANRPSPEVRDKLKQAAHDVAVYLSSPAARSATFDVVRQRVQGEVWYALDPSKRLRSSGQPQQLLRMAKGLRGLLGEVTGLVEEGCGGFDAREVAKVRGGGCEHGTVRAVCLQHMIDPALLSAGSMLAVHGWHCTLGWSTLAGGRASRQLSTPAVEPCACRCTEPKRGRRP
jgi:hypothetical protein